MNIRLDKLALGKWRYLSDAELSLLMENVADSNKEHSESKPAARGKKAASHPKEPVYPKSGDTPKGPKPVRYDKAAKPDPKKANNKPAKLKALETGDYLQKNLPIPAGCRTSVGKE